MTSLIAPPLYMRPLALPHSLTPLDETPRSVASDSPAPRQISALKTALGDQCNRRTLVDRLQHIVQTLPAQVRAEASSSLPAVRAQMEATLAARLKSTLMYVCEDSSYPPQPPLPANRLISLDAYLRGWGLTPPTTLEALIDLKDSTARQAQIHPLGNFSGALGWPLAMPGQDQDSLVNFLHSSTRQVPGLPLPEGGTGTLGYLLSGSSVSDADLADPMLALEKLLASPKAQALGEVLQTRLGGVPTPGAGDDYVLTALHLGLDPHDQAAPTRNHIAGFDLASSQYWGQPASAVIDGLGKHLLEQGRVSARTARLGAYLLLARTAPQYLVKDLPAGVTYGSVMWAQLAMAVARIEAQTPGRTLAMGYAQILLAAEQLKSDPALGQAINHDALRDWGVVNGVLRSAAETPSVTEMERVRAAYNHQLSALKTTTTLLQTQIPSRRALALAQLSAAFPDLDPRLFEVKSIQKARLKTGRPGLHPGARSMLDIVMEGGKLKAEEHWVSNDSRLPITAFCSLYERGKLGVADAFKSAFDGAIRAQEEGHQGKVRQLIATLPLEDRKNLEFGKLEFFHTNQYKIAGDLFTPPALHVRGHTLEIKATRNGQVNLYTLDTRRGTIEKENYLLRRRTAPYTDDKLQTREANILARTVVFEPAPGLAQRFVEQAQGAALPDSFNSPRSQAIADLFVKSLDLKNDDLLKEARGITSYDQDSARNEAIGQFFLNLIPLRSAIVNFKKGNVGQGVFDLAVDAVGLLTLGAGKAAHAGKVLGAALSTARHAAKAARFVGATLVEAFNPLSGMGDLLAGGARSALRGARHAAARVTRQFNQLRGAAGRYDLLKAASKTHGEAATGTFKVAGEQVEGGAVLHSGQWYPLDTQTMRLYGRPMDDFTPGARAVDGQLTHLPAAADVVEPVSVKADLGREIGAGAEGTVYESLDGKSVYKDFGPTRWTSAEGRRDMEVVNLNKYYGEGFAELRVEEGRKYIKMGKIDGVDLSKFEKGSLPPSVRPLLDDALAQMEAKDIYHNDLQLKNFMYSQKDNKVYPVDMNGMPGEFMVEGVIDVYQRHAAKLRKDFAALIAPQP
ncbi:hypothetical protein [Pseudomonas sp. FP2309]|uniref:OspG family effector kinase n=1 Tax=Pseudomonas sp. FP2309 TaxID=2954091 RepID=UPI00273505BD|nr:hypothetical protein [Pseudomonas sp. FP2309]WLH69977.1 hypothetical protein PSH59_07615 [Pseudomonas sp. FP2309]